MLDAPITSYRDHAVTTNRELDAIEAMIRLYATAASPGPWRAAGNDVLCETAVLAHAQGQNSQADAAYIAAVSPDRVLLLLDELWRLRCSAHREPSVVRPSLTEAE